MADAGSWYVSYRLSQKKMDAQLERSSMRYQEFVRVVERELNKKLRGGVHAAVYKAVKNNGKEKQGILIESPGIHISPTIYLDEFYGDYEAGKDLGEIVEEVLSFYDEVRCESPWDFGALEDYGNICKKMCFKLINTEKNRAMLKVMPHIDILDLSIVFYVVLEMTESGSATMPVYNSHLARWGVSTHQIWKDARKNAMGLLPAQFFTMSSVLENGGEEEQEEKDCFEENFTTRNGKGAETDLFADPLSGRDTMYVLSNPVRSLGAACILYPKVLNMIGGILGEDYYILPSSIHEVVIVPKSRGLEPGEMNEMVSRINETQVMEEEVLSNHAYFYACREKKLTGCSLQSAGIMLG